MTQYVFHPTAPLPAIPDLSIMWIDGKGGDFNSFVHFNDPDSNGWVNQERPAAG